MLASLGALVFSSTLWLGAETFYRMKNQQAAHERSLLQAIHLQLLETRIADGECLSHLSNDATFHEQGVNNALRKRNAGVLHMRQQIENMKQISNEPNLLGKLMLLLNKYDQHFLALTEAYRERGFKDWGLVGQFRDAIHELEDGFQQLDQQSLTIELLQLRRHEKDYLLRHEPQYIERVYARLARLTDGVRKLDAASSSSFHKLLTDYETAFRGLLDKEIQIGVMRNAGLHRETQLAAHDFHFAIDNLIFFAEKNEAATQQQSAIIMAFTLVLGTLVAIGLSALISRTMTQPLTELLRATKHVSEGDFSVNAEISTCDEIGELARSFVVMTTTLRDVAKVANEVSSGNYTTDFHCRGEKDVLGASLANMTKTLREKTEENQKQTAELEAVHRLQMRFRAALDVSADAIFLIDRESMRFIDMNKSACVEMGYSRDELLAMGPHDIKPNTTKDELARKFDEIIETKDRGGVIDTHHQRKDGTTFPVGIILQSLENDGRTIFVASVRDLTERKQNETELELMHQKLVDSARKAGKAEIATSVLHNVGNVLNSVNVSAGLIQDKVHKSGVSSLTKAVGVLGQHRDNIGDYVTQDERGKHLPRFLADLSQKMASEEQLILDEVRSLIKNIDHIKSIVATQQAYATGVSAAVEKVSMAELLEDAIHINSASMQRHAIQIVRRFDDLDPVMVDKQKALQILVNLISNAKYACMGSKNENHEITISLRNADEGQVLIEVQDNGMGIAAENMTRIFAHGFTTRKKGHGFGLHSAALTAKELAGNLRVHSDGPGMGAAFTLYLPYKMAGVLL